MAGAVAGQARLVTPLGEERDHGALSAAEALDRVELHRVGHTNITIMPAALGHDGVDGVFEVELAEVGLAHCLPELGHGIGDDARRQLCLGR